MSGTSAKVAVFRSADDESVRSVGVEGGSLVVSEVLSGPSALVAYGEREHVLRVVFSPEHRDELADALAREGGFASLEEFVSREENGVDRLMDVCDRAGVPYTFIAAGSSGDVQFRPSRSGA